VLSVLAPARASQAACEPVSATCERPNGHECVWRPLIVVVLPVPRFQTRTSLPGWALLSPRPKAMRFPSRAST